MQQPNLKKSITFIQALCIVVGGVIGSGIFMRPGSVLESAGTPVMAILAWVLGGVVMLAVVLSIAELTVTIPKSGGLYTYLTEIYGEKVGFLFGWGQSMITGPALIAALSIALSTNLSILINLNGAWQTVVSISVLGFILLMNILSTKNGGIIQVVTTIGKLLPIAAIIGFGFVSNLVPNFSAVTGSTRASGFGVAILATLWAYDGALDVTYLAGEVKNPEKTLPKIMSIGVIIIILVYAIFNVALFKSVPYEELVGHETPGALAAQTLFGNSGGKFLIIGMIVSVFGTLNGYLMTSARVPQTMSEENNFPAAKIIGKVNKKFETPANALIFQAIVAVIYILSGGFEVLADLLIFVLWIFFTLGVIGVFIMRKKHKPAKDRYRIPLYPITPLVGIIGALYILVSTVIEMPILSFIGIGITLLGIPVLHYIKRR